MDTIWIFFSEEMARIGLFLASEKMKTVLWRRVVSIEPRLFSFNIEKP
jgi:hypothetical protein